MQYSKAKSFTLIELLIVIVIIGILAIALIPRLTGAQGAARDAARRADLNTLSTALAMYAADHNGNYPPSSSPSCIGASSGTKCRPGLTQNNGSIGSNGGGNDALNTILLQYMRSIPLDPQASRSVGGNYMYYNGYSAHTKCGGGENIYHKARLVRQPEKKSPTTDEECSPGTRACCSMVGCGSHKFCMLQLN